MGRSIAAVFQILLGCRTPRGGLARLGAFAGVAGLAGLAVVFLAGCSASGSLLGHLAGTNDEELVYAVDEAPPNGPALPALVARGVKARLASAAILADVDLTDENVAPRVQVRVTVDTDVAPAADDLVTWRGGLRFLRVDVGTTIVPTNTSGLHPVETPTPEGKEHGWQGTAEAVARAVRDTKLDPSHVAFAERVGGNSPEWRTRVAVVPPVAVAGPGDAPILAVASTEHGRALAIGLSPVTKSALGVERLAHPHARVVVARGRVLLETLPIDDAIASVLVLRFGDDLASYTRAYRNSLLLRSPVLPPMHRVSAGPLPPRRGIAVACALVPFLLSFAWLFFVRRFDRARPEPLWLVVATFALGGLAIVPAGLLEMGLGNLSPWLEPSLATLGGQAWALPLSIAVFTLVVGAVEESAKYLAAWLLPRRRREFDEPVDGIVYGCAAALGFAAVENMKYFGLGRMSGAVIAVRAFETVPAHMFFGAIWGYGMGLTLVSRRARVLPYLALAALAHGTFDAVVSTDGMQLVATVLVLALALAFVVMLRRSLRHGTLPAREIRAAGPLGETPRSQLARVFFRVGSAPAFYSSAGAMVFCAFSLTVLGTAYEVLHHRVGVVFVALASAMLALLGLAAWGATVAIPLDVAVDALGVTFAGACTPWSTITSHFVETRRGRSYVVLRTPSGDQRLGPTRETTAVRIAEAILANAPGAPGS
ncbi:MAG TPA: PrsW family intramembrane metalloprotease [Polyangiaceae bacterium]